MSPKVIDDQYESPLLVPGVKKLKVMFDYLHKIPCMVKQLEDFHFLITYNILPTERYNHLEKSFVKHQTLQPCLLLSSAARLFQLLSAFREI